MRKDIEIHINTGDAVVDAANKPKLYPFTWTTNSTGLSRYIYGEIQIPGNIPETTIRNNGIYSAIPYTPKYKEFYIRIRRVYSEETSSFVQNPVDGGEWFLVKTGLYGRDMENAFASQLLMISEDKFYFKLHDGVAEIYSGNESDFNIVPADRQNANLLLKCVPTNNYRYPLSGIGLNRWINSNIHHTELSSVVKNEFDADGMYIKSATFDLETKKLNLDLEPYEKENGTT